KYSGMVILPVGLSVSPHRARTRSEVLVVRPILQETGKTFLHARQLHQEGRGCLRRLLDQGRGIEVGLRVVDGEHKWGLAGPRQDVAHDQSARAVIALDVQLWLAQDTDIHACRTLPG